MFDNTTEGKLKAARALGIGKTTLYRKLAEFKNNVTIQSPAGIASTTSLPQSAE
jgi:hypothetical protein